MKNDAAYLAASMGSELHDYYDGSNDPALTHELLVLEVLEDSTISYRVTDSKQRVKDHLDVDVKAGLQIVGTITRFKVTSGRVLAYDAPR